MREHLKASEIFQRPTVSKLKVAIHLIDVWNNKREAELN